MVATVVFIPIPGNTSKPLAVLRKALPTRTQRIGVERYKPTITASAVQLTKTNQNEALIMKVDWKTTNCTALITQQTLLIWIKLLAPGYLQIEWYTKRGGSYCFVLCIRYPIEKLSCNHGFFERTWTYSYYHADRPFFVPLFVSIYHLANMSLINKYNVSEMGFTTIPHAITHRHHSITTQLSLSAMEGKRTWITGSSEILGEPRGDSQATSSFNVESINAISKLTPPTSKLADGLI